MSRKVLAIIPARGGSKGLPRKNIRPLAGKPLIAWSIEAALEVHGIDECLVSTDDPEIAEVARAHGAQVPFLRPAELAADDTPGSAPILHALQTLDFRGTIVLLQPTSPLRTAADIRGALDLHRPGLDPVVSVRQVEDKPNWMFRQEPGGRLRKFLESEPLATRRQDLPPLLIPNGAVYVADSVQFVETGSFFTERTLGYEMPRERSIDIDTELDLAMAETILQRGGNRE